MKPTETTCCGGTQFCNLPFSIGRRDQTLAYTGACGNVGHSPPNCQCGCCEGPGDILSIYNVSPGDLVALPTCEPI